MSPYRAPASAPARRRPFFAAAGVGCLAAAGRAPGRVVRNHSWRQLRRRLRAHAGGDAPDGRRARRCRARGCGRHSARGTGRFLSPSVSTWSSRSAARSTAPCLQRFVVTPNEQVRESPFIEHNIAATRRAFGLETVEVRPLSGDALLTRNDITNNAATLENVRLWDHQPLLETFGQIQEIRTYYDFVSVDNDRYPINGSLRQVMLSARELNSASLPNRTWVNERLTFTHGYGLTLGPVNQVTSEGLPVLFVRDLPPQTTVDLKIDEPSIYFGELIQRLRDRAHGDARVPLPSRRRQRIHAVRGNWWRLAGIVLAKAGLRAPLRGLSDRPERRHRPGEPDPLQSQHPRAHQRRWRRSSASSIRIRISSSPTARLYWLYDAYTASTSYPYSTPSGPVNYIRNSVKFVIDAYNGTTTAYLADPERSDRGDVRAHLPEHVQATRRDAGEPALARPLSGRHLRAAGAGLCDVPHDAARRVLQPGGSVGGAERR